MSCQEWFTLIIQLIGAGAAVIAAIAASIIANRWSKRKDASENIRILKYYIGQMKLTRSGFDFLIYNEIGAIDQPVNSKRVKEEVKSLLGEVEFNKLGIVGFLPKDKVKEFLNLLLIMKELIESPDQRDFDKWEQRSSEFNNFIVMLEDEQILLEKINKSFIKKKFKD